MKTTILALTALAALTATPAFAGSTHISVGLFAPAPVYAAPVYYQPAPVYYQQPVVYYPPVRHVYFAPPRNPHWEARNHHDRRGYNVAWDDHRPGGWNGPRH